MNKNHLPLVSVIMPVHNAGSFLVEAIESILNQTYKNLELIIVDDESTDNSWSLIQKYARRFPKKIKAVHTKKQSNSAGNGATNFGLQYAKGQFIARMDADDIALPGRIAKQVKFILKHPGTILLGTQAYVIDRNGRRTGYKRMPISHESIYANYGVLHPVIHPSVMINRRLLPNPDRIYEMKWDVNDDYYTFFKLLNYGKFANLPEYLLKYRIHGANLSLQHPKKKFIDSLKIRIEAVRKLNYRMTQSNWLMLFAQTILVLVLPEPLIVPVYRLVKGINHPKVRLFKKLKKFSYRSITPNFFRKVAMQPA